jgi:hypothetical protein
MTRIFTSIAETLRAASRASGSTCWQVSSGLLQTLPASHAKLATIHVLSLESVAMKGISTRRDFVVGDPVGTALDQL